MSYGELLPVRAFGEAMPRRIKEQKLAVGVVYTSMIDFKEAPPKSIIMEPVAVRQNAIIERVTAENHVFFRILDEDLQPVDMDIDADINDGILDLTGFRIDFPDNFQNAAGQNLPFELRTHTGFFVDYHNPVDISSLEASEDMTKSLSLTT